MLNRSVQPLFGINYFKTYFVNAPLQTHFREGTCEEYGCERFFSGFKVILNESDANHAASAHYIRHDKTRKYTEHKGEDGLTTFTFPPGTECFRKSPHMIRIERPEVFGSFNGDFRGTTGGGRHVHKRPEDWVEDFALHQDKVKTRIERG